jgi:hypothetical protein
MNQSELIHVVTALKPAADRYNTNPQTDYISLKDYKSVMFAVQHGSGASGTAVITAQMAEDASGTGATDIPFTYRRVAAVGTSDVPGAITAATAAGFTTTAGSDQLYLIEINAEELDSDSPFVALTLTEGVNSPVDGAVLAILGEPRYAGSTPMTAIA